MNNKSTLRVIFVYFLLLVVMICLGLFIIGREIRSFKDEIETMIAINDTNIEETYFTPVSYHEEFIPYDVNLSSDLQKYIIDICDGYHISPSLVMSVIYYESNCDPNVCGDGGYTYGLMGINTKWCKDIMEKVGCYDMTDPYQNVTVGIDILADKLYKYDGNPEMALMAYNAGDYGANKYWFSNYIYSTEYSRKIMSMAQKLEEMKEI